ncbi:MAG: uracil-DNA glycosylase [Candidatus Saccharimonadales bacterium]
MSDTQTTLLTADEKQKLLDHIKAEILEKNVCPELAKTATQLVFGDGNPSAEIVFIGEAPGKNEDLKGMPFIGAAGKFLNEMLEGIGLERKDVYITNIVKYRPPNNRDPLPEEKKAFLSYLQAQLEVIQPKIVVTLGRHSMNCFLPDLQISKIHGEAKRIKIRMKQNETDVLTLVILPLFHPAAALYNGGLRQTLIDDFAGIPHVIDLITKETK